MSEFRTLRDGGSLTATPRFARTATELLLKGEVEDALALCLAGTQLFPRYATGHLVLGRCYDALGRTAEAMLEYRNAGETFPDNAVIISLYETVKRKEDEGYQSFAQSRSEALQGWKDRMTFDEFLATREDVPVQSTVQVAQDTVGGDVVMEPASAPQPEPPPPASDVDEIIQKLGEAPRRITPAPDQPPVPPASHPDTGGRFITATLAEIYASQGEYDEAIEAYRKLAEQRPGSASRYLQRLTEIEQLKAAIEARRESPRNIAD